FLRTFPPASTSSLFSYTTLFRSLVNSRRSIDSMLIPPKSFAILLFLILPEDSRLLRKVIHGFAFGESFQSGLQSLLKLVHLDVDLFSHILFLFVGLPHKKVALG